MKCAEDTVVYQIFCFFIGLLLVISTVNAVTEKSVGESGRDFGKIERWQNLSLTENVRVERAPQRPTSVRPKIVAPTQIVVTRSTRPPRSTTVRNNPVRNATKPTVRRCGVHHKNVEDLRIVGGGLATVDEWPWMAALLREGKEQFCGGVLVTDEHVLTAAHCVFGQGPSAFKVRLGEYDFGVKSKAERDFRVSRIFVHEEYNNRNFKNDIALLRLNKQVKFNRHIRPICLPTENVVLEGQAGYVTGWGTTSFSGESSKVLLEVLLPIWTQSECQAALNGRVFTEKQLCAGYKKGGKDSCQGDSGGPLMLQKGRGQWSVIGIVSWGLRCAVANQPGVYTRVMSYLPWIKDKILIE